MPSFEPTSADLEWVKNNIVPKLMPALNTFKGAFERVDLLQDSFSDWPQRQAVVDHFDSLGLSVRRFSGFIGHKNQNTKTAHLDAFVRGIPCVARFNIPYFGRSPVKLEWWNDGVDSDKIKERVFTELRYGQPRIAYSYKSTIDDWGTDSAFAIDDPGPCWNRTELAHRVQGPDCSVNRIQITVEVKDQIPWTELVARLERLGYC